MARLTRRGVLLGGAAVLLTPALPAVAAGAAVSTGAGSSTGAGFAAGSAGTGFAAGAGFPAGVSGVSAGVSGVSAGSTGVAVSGVSAVSAVFAVEQPAIASCGAWGARPPQGSLTIDEHRPNKIIVHHTALANSTDYSQAHAFANSRDIQNLHMDTNHWIDSGQHFTNSRGGWLTEGRHGSLYALLHGQTMVQGAHCVGQNDQAIGVENEGTYLTEQPPAALWNSLIDFCAFVCHQYAIPATEIYGHKDFNTTQCPGLLHDRLPELRSAVAARL